MNGKSMDYVLLNQEDGTVIEIKDGKINVNYQGWKLLDGEKDEKPSIWMFPKFTKVKASDAEQFNHVIGELREAGLYMLLEMSCGETSVLTDMEVLDVIHSCETFLRNRRTDEEVADLIERVTEKNAKRGYYDDLGGQS